MRIVQITETAGVRCISWVSRSPKSSTLPRRGRRNLMQLGWDLDSLVAWPCAVTRRLLCHSATPQQDGKTPTGQTQSTAACLAGLGWDLAKMSSGNGVWSPGTILWYCSIRGPCFWVDHRRERTKLCRNKKLQAASRHIRNKRRDDLCQTRRKSGASRVLC